MTRADRILLAVLVLVCAVSVPVVALGAHAGQDATLRGPQGQTSISLSDDGRYEVQGRLGVVVFEVKDGALRCVSSGCPDLVCVRAGALSPSKPIVCAPNGVVAVLSGDGGDLDAISR